MNKIKKFLLNGQQYYTSHNICILDLVNYFNYNSSLLVLEYNNLICNKKNWNNILIKNNDKIEIVTIVGGG
jgi:sulfur carrier protein